MYTEDLFVVLKGVILLLPLIFCPKHLHILPVPNAGCGFQELYISLRMSGLVSCKMFQIPHGIWNEINCDRANLQDPTDCTS